VIFGDGTGAGAFCSDFGAGRSEQPAQNTAALSGNARDMRRI
jgi:hypothetical protein